jgi:hypothetical protein
MKGVIKMKRFSNNTELYQYLVSLAADLNGLRFCELSEAVTHASRQASGMSTEFLGESRIALRRVMRERGDALNAEQRSDLFGVLKQLDDALDKR